MSTSIRCTQCHGAHYNNEGICPNCGEVWERIKGLENPAVAVVIGKSDNRLIADLMRLEVACFGDLGDEFDEEYYRELLESDDNLKIFLEQDSVRVGCLIFVPHNQAVEELEDDDPGIQSDPARFYIETVEILPKYHGKGGLSKMLTVAKGYGVTKISLHARVNNQFSAKIQGKLKNLTVRHIASWPYYEDKGPCDYITGEL